MGLNVKKICTGLAVVVMLLQLGIVFTPAVEAKDPAVPTDLSSTKAKDSLFCIDKNENPPGGDPINNDSSPILGKNSLFYKIIQTVTVITGAVSIIMVMVGGFKYIVSGGDGPAIF
jgi:hypothetical protein